MNLPELPAGIPRNLVYESGRLRILDQTLLPGEIAYLDAESLETVAEAICALRVRGAPALGVAAAYGLCVALADFLGRNPRATSEEVRSQLIAARATLAATRPTAVNLTAALDMMLDARDSLPGPPQDLLASLEARAHTWHLDDALRCEAIAAAGLSVLPRNARLLTHCNAGPLATGGVGTALGVILRGQAQGRCFTVFADETRPLLQGARLTTWELRQAGVPVTLQADGAAASLILGGGVDAVIVGADRIALNGDTANKVGTLPLALACARAKLPFYVAAPLSTLDSAAKDGGDIVIEEREGRELSHWRGLPLAAEGIGLRNPAFDVTPGELVTVFFTEAGVQRPPLGSGPFDSQSR